MIEVVRGVPDRPWAGELLKFWADRHAVAGPEARRRLGEVVCLLRRDGAIAGVSSTYAADVALVGRRRFWIYRSLLLPGVIRSEPEMISATFGALAAEFDRRPGSPIGLCVLVGDPDERRRRPEVEWSDPRMIYAGYLDDGRQVRIAYFDQAVITRGADG